MKTFRGDAPFYHDTHLLPNWSQMLVLQSNLAAVSVWLQHCQLFQHVSHALLFFTQQLSACLHYWWIAFILGALPSLNYFTCSKHVLYQQPAHLPTAKLAVSTLCLQTMLLLRSMYTCTRLMYNVASAVLLHDHLHLLVYILVCILTLPLEPDCSFDLALPVADGVCWMHGSTPLVCCLF